MSHYKTNLRDIEFNLFEVLNIGDHLGAGPFASVDRDTAHQILTEVDRLAREEFAASFVEGDRVELEVCDGEVALPPGVTRSLDAYYDGDWDLLTLPSHMGGYGAPPSLIRATQELLAGANPSAYFYLIGPLMARVIDEVGTEEQAGTWSKWMVERHWGGTMVLTEPDAGSDVGAGRTSAIEADDGTWHLEGVKRFITSGEHDYAENIVHLVLARREGGPSGTKGLSMFIVPKFLVDDAGNPVARNGVVCTHLEEKMGIRGSSTCELTFGADRPAVGYLVGGVHEGIRQMFRVLEDARMLVGIKSAATLSTAYLNAAAYAKERVQGRDMTRLADRSAERVPIFAHPDVKRMLVTQKAHAEGMRALAYYTAWAQDQAVLHPDDDHWSKLGDLLLPLVKGYSSEKCYELLSSALQVFGGYGYSTEYPIEQYIRDAKIDSLYEGTTGIQALDLFFRKIVRDQGATLARFANEMRESAKAGGGDDPFTAEREQLDRSLDDVQAQVGALVGWLMASQGMPAQIYKVGLQANSLLEALAEVVIGWLLLRHAETAEASLGEAEAADRGFYRGKIVAARWFIATVLPKSDLRRRLAEQETGMLMDFDDAAA